MWLPFNQPLPAVGEVLDRLSFPGDPLGGLMAFVAEPAKGDAARTFGLPLTRGTAKWACRHQTGPQLAVTSMAAENSSFKKQRKLDRARMP